MKFIKFSVLVVFALTALLLKSVDSQAISGTIGCFHNGKLYTVIQPGQLCENFAVPQSVEKRYPTDHDCIITSAPLIP